MNDSRKAVTFLGKELIIPSEDHTDPSFMLFLSNIEMMEKKFGEGIIYMNDLKKNYGLQFGNREFTEEIQMILVNYKGKR